MTDMLARLAADVGDRYAVERELGRGGMATVYLARDLVADREVAIKVMDPELAAAVGSERFKREIDVASRLQHPHILGVHDSGGAAGTLYYVMPYVTGESLRARLDRETQLPVDEAVRLACEVASALNFAHAQGVVHRDIKPENVLLQDGHALVADFGIARATSATDSASLTKTGVAIGTPQYMSPEQIFAEKDIDGRTDEYALACLLYEMLAGQPPFVGPHAQSLMAQHALDDPPLVSRFRATVPTHVEDALLTALAKTRADRFPTLGDFSDALCSPGKHVSPLRATRTRGMAALPPPAVPRPAWRRALPVAGTLLFVVAASAGAWQLWGNRTGAERTVAELVQLRRIAVLQFTADDSALVPVADGLTGALIDRLRPIGELEVRSRTAVAAFRGSELSADSIGRALDVGRVVTGALSRVGDGLRVNVELRDAENNLRVDAFRIEQASGDVLAMRDSLAERVTEALRQAIGKELKLKEGRASTRSVPAWTAQQRAERARLDAELAYGAGNGARVTELLARADSLARRAAELDDAWPAPHVQRATIALRRADALMATDPDAAGRWLDSVVAHADAALALDATDPDALDLRGGARFGQSRLAAATPALAEALRTRAETDLLSAVQNAPTQATAYNTLSRIAYARKDVPEARNMAEKALQADAFLVNAAATYYRVFVTSFDLGSFENARKWCDRGRERYPADALFVDCQLLLLLSGYKPPTPAEAWRLVPELLERTPPDQRDYQRRYAEMHVASAIGRVAGLRDSASRVLVRNRADATIDPRGELKGVEAMVRAQIGDIEGSIALIQEYLTEHPDHRAGFTSARSWLWNPVRGDPRFRSITALGR